MNSLTIPWDLSPTTDNPPPHRSRPSSSANDTQSHQMVTMASLMLAPGQSYHPQIDLKHFDSQTYQSPTTFTFTSNPPHFRSGSQRARQSSSSTTSRSSVSSDQDYKSRLESLASSTSPPASASASTPPSSASPPTSASPSSSSSAGDGAAGSGGDSFSHWNVGIFGGAGGFGISGGEGGAECLACGYRYEDLGVLAEHQRMEHGLVDVVF